MTTTITNPIKTMECPECGSAAQLYVEPSMWAGIWECTNEDCGVSDNCIHKQNHDEAIEVDILVNNEHDTYPVIVSICDDCDAILEPTTEYGAGDDN